MNVKCPSCGALHFAAERVSGSSKQNLRFQVCCANGKVQFPLLQPPPEPLRNLLTSNDRAVVNFRADIWKYNRALSFTLLGVKEDRSVNKGNGPPVFQISGELHHLSGALSPAQGRLPRYAQLYVHDPQEALDARISQNEGLDKNTMKLLQQMLLGNHSYVPLYKHAFEILEAHDHRNDIEVCLCLTPELDHRRYNLPTSNEVAVILSGTAASEPRDIVLRCRDGPLRRISDLHTAYSPLQYPLLFPRGENGWYPEMRLTETEAQQEKRVNAQNQRRQDRIEQGIEDEADADDHPDNSHRLTILSE